jgi:hypothetical protein
MGNSQKTVNKSKNSNNELLQRPNIQPSEINSNNIGNNAISTTFINSNPNMMEQSIYNNNDTFSKIKQYLKYLYKNNFVSLSFVIILFKIILG